MTTGGFTTCLWFDGQAEEAADFYLSVFKDGQRGRVSRCTEAGPGEAGSVLGVEFTARPAHTAAQLATAPKGQPGPPRTTAR